MFLKKQLEFRGIKRELIIEYILSILNLQLSHIRKDNDNSIIIKKDDLMITLSEEDLFSVAPSINFPRLFITFEGDESKIDKLIKQLRNRTMRLGG